MPSELKEEERTEERVQPVIEVLNQMLAGIEDYVFKVKD
jgi:hypothetical protein